MKGLCDNASTGGRKTHWKSAAGRKLAGYHMHLHACPSRRRLPHVVVPLLSLLRSRRTFPRTRIVRRKRLRDLNLDACITSKMHTEHRGSRGRNPTFTSLIPSRDPPDPSIRRWRMSAGGSPDATRRMFNVYTHLRPSDTCKRLSCPGEGERSGRFKTILRKRTHHLQVVPTRRYHFQNMNHW